MSNAGLLTRGDRRHNEKLTRLRSIVRPDLAIVGIDPASRVQGQVDRVVDHVKATAA